jgi:hypothetical protein
LRKLGRVDGMKGFVAALGAVAVLLAVSAGAQQPAPSPAAKTAAKAGAKAARPRLNLGPWGAQYSDGPPGAPILPDSPRFQDRVDVEAAPRDINTTMQQWWDSYNLQYSIYGRGLNVRTPKNGGVPLVSMSWGGKDTANHTKNPPLPQGPDKN